MNAGLCSWGDTQNLGLMCSKLSKVYEDRYFFVTFDIKRCQMSNHNVCTMLKAKLRFLNRRGWLCKALI